MREPSDVFRNGDEMVIAEIQFNQRAHPADSLGREPVKVVVIQDQLRQFKRSFG